MACIIFDDGGNGSWLNTQNIHLDQSCNSGSGCYMIETLWAMYKMTENKVLLIGIFINKVEVIFSNSLDAAIISLNYDLFLTNILQRYTAVYTKLLRF